MTMVDWEMTTLEWQRTAFYAILGYITGSFLSAYYIPLWLHHIDITEGTISKTYPSIFLVEIVNDLDATTQTVSYSYTDVLTKDVQMQLL